MPKYRAKSTLYYEKFLCFISSGTTFHYFVTSRTLLCFVSGLTTFHCFLMYRTLLCFVSGLMTFHCFVTGRTLLCFVSGRTTFLCFVTGRTLLCCNVSLFCDRLNNVYLFYTGSNNISVFFCLLVDFIVIKNVFTIILFLLNTFKYSSPKSSQFVRLR